VEITSAAVRLPEKEENNVVAQKTFGVSPVRSIVIALAVIGVLLVGALGLAALSSGSQTSSGGRAAAARAFPYGPADSHQVPAGSDRTQTHGPR
jgi:hypothetical protein